MRFRAGVDNEDALGVATSRRLSSIRGHRRTFPEASAGHMGLFQGV